MDGKDAIIARITEEAEKTAASLIRDAENERAEAEKLLRFLSIVSLRKKKPRSKMSADALFRVQSLLRDWTRASLYFLKNSPRLTARTVKPRIPLPEIKSVTPS